MNRSTLIMIFGITFLLLTSCWPTNVSLKENSMPEEWKTFYVIPLEVNNSTAPSNYSGVITESVRSAVQNNTRLKMTNSVEGADVIISGQVVNYNTSPAAIQANDNASLNRLTISVNYLIQTKTKGLEQQEFTSSKFVDFPSSNNLADVETELLIGLNQLLVQDVINKLLSNW